jgi:hypothetical protein
MFRAHSAFNSAGIRLFFFAIVLIQKVALDRVHVGAFDR